LRRPARVVRAGEGANIKTVSKMLGHSSVKITLDVYGHLMPGMQADTLGHLDGVFSYRLRSPVWCHCGGWHHGLILLAAQKPRFAGL
jgi:hypothetical protein